MTPQQTSRYILQSSWSLPLFSSTIGAGVIISGRKGYLLLEGDMDKILLGLSISAGGYCGISGLFPVSSHVLTRWYWISSWMLRGQSARQNSRSRCSMYSRTLFHSSFLVLSFDGRPDPLRYVRRPAMMVLIAPKAVTALWEPLAAPRAVSVAA